MRTCHRCKTDIPTEEPSWYDEFLDTYTCKPCLAAEAKEPRIRQLEGLRDSLMYQIMELDPGCKRRFMNPKPQRPRVVCLCGSTRFGEAFLDANLRETLAGRIVLTIGCDFKSDQALGLKAYDKMRLDELHKRKIDLADEVLVLNVGGYIGESTRSEIEYAQGQRKPIRYLESGFGCAKENR